MPSIETYRKHAKQLVRWHRERNYSITVASVKALFHEYDARGVSFGQRLVRQPWGGLDFHVRDPDGNVVSFVQFR